MRAEDDLRARLRADARTMMLLVVLVPLALVITTLEWWHGRRY